ncbi:hypothetical protein DBT_1577 [Dissulfuribacter thermophilus]|uniref:Uncharacterized protein n=2 Tax=Dissulfuribacter thermophilus TaxID=1156395 RepID=A0A1B9F5Q0_9BACT|nr:hypothetical protein DBT_1577 [Dissulfuribacter thermophilus]
MRLLEYNAFEGQWRSFFIAKEGKGPLKVISHENFFEPGHKKEDLFVSILSKNSHIMLSDFPKTKKEILRLQINERIRQEALLEEGMNLVHRIKKISSTEGQERLSIVSLSAADISVPLDIALKNKNIRIKGIFSEISSIAGLLGAITKGPVMAAIFREKGLEILVTREKIPLYSQIIPLDVTGSVDLTMLEQTFELVRQNVERLHNIQVQKTICLGPGREICPKKIGNKEFWEPDFKKIIEISDPSLILKHPGAFGAYFALKEYDFTPSIFKTAYVIRRVNSFVSGALVLSALFTGILGFNLYRENKKLYKEYTFLLKNVTSKKEKLEAILPSNTEKALIERYVDIYKKSVEQPRPHEVLLRLASFLPSEVKILSFEIKRENTAISRPTPPPSTYMPQSSSIQFTSPIDRLFNMPLKMDIVLVTQGTFMQTRTRFEETISNIASIYSVKNVNWDYDKISRKGKLSCTITLQGKKGEGNRA